MDYKIGDTVKISVYVTEKWSRLVTCKITNKYIRNNTTYYSLQEISRTKRIRPCDYLQCTIFAT